MSVATVRLRVATYNVWNAAQGWESRAAAIAETLAALDADLLALQEVPVLGGDGHEFVRRLARATALPHTIFMPHAETPEPGERAEGLAVLARRPISLRRTDIDLDAPGENNHVLAVRGSVDGVGFALTVVHLDWRSASAREAGLRALDRRLPAEADAVSILCGDFNDHADSDAAGLLTGALGWTDAWDAAPGTADDAASLTLDFERNPRWAAQPTGERPGRFDRVYMRPAVAVAGARTFGHEPAGPARVVPSDHYGVVVDLEVPFP